MYTGHFRPRTQQGLLRRVGYFAVFYRKQEEAAQDGRCPAGRFFIPSPINGQPVAKRQSDSVTDLVSLNPRLATPSIVKLAGAARVLLSGGPARTRVCPQACDRFR